jgi:hypothetical protein
MTVNFTDPPGTPLFTTIHGSHLYGLNHPGSDLDTFTVTTSANPKARQRINTDGTDTATVGFDAFLIRALTGSHQSVEALFSPYQTWHTHPELAPVLANLRIGGGAVAAKYERTITSFAHGDYKKRRHGARLALNLDQLRRHGRFNPVLTAGEKEYISDVAHHAGDQLLTELFTRLPRFPPSDRPTPHRAVSTGTEPGTHPIHATGDPDHHPDPPDRPTTRPIPPL